MEKDIRASWIIIKINKGKRWSDQGTSNESRLTKDHLEFTASRMDPLKFTLTVAPSVSVSYNLTDHESTNILYLSYPFKRLYIHLNICFHTTWKIKYTQSSVLKSNTYWRENPLFAVKLHKCINFVGIWPISFFARNQTQFH